MGLFSFSGGKDKVANPPSARKNAPHTKRVATTPGAGTNKPVVKQKSSPKEPVSVNTPGGSPQARSTYVITRKDEIPNHSAVLSATGNPLELIPEWQKNYAVLLISKERKDVLILVSTEIFKQGLDDDYLAIVDRINRSGFTRTKKILAKPEILAIVYESGTSLKSQEDTQRAATKIQLDFDDLLRVAIAADATDVHIEVERDAANVRFRINGDMTHHTEWPVRYARTMAGVIYQVIADEKDTTFDEARPQDAIIDRELDENTRIRVRLSTIPAYPAGFNMTMRLLKMGQDGKRTSLDKLGYERPQLRSIRRAVAKPVGAVVMAGTTGSGKSTSLNSMLGEKIEAYKGKLKVITVEDPPEYVLRGATQVPVVRSRSQAKAGGDSKVNPFASVVRAAMRSDPDILMVGEVRDESSAELLIHAVQSGHQVFTTVHASSGIDIVPRLRSNGIGNDVLGGQNFISALMYQTLLPTVCPHCAQPYEKAVKSFNSDQEHELVERIRRFLKPALISSLRFRNDAGCDHCSQGVTGRTVASEVILPDAYMLKCFRDMQEAEAFMHYRRKGGKIALEHGLLKAFKGITDIRDVESKLDQITALYEHDLSTRVFANLKPTAHFMIDENVFEETPLVDEGGDHSVDAPQAQTKLTPSGPANIQAESEAPSISTETALSAAVDQKPADAAPQEMQLDVNTETLSQPPVESPKLNIGEGSQSHASARDHRSSQEELLALALPLIEQSNAGKNQISIETVAKYLNKESLAVLAAQKGVDSSAARRLNQLVRLLGKQRLASLADDKPQIGRFIEENRSVITGPFKSKLLSGESPEKESGEKSAQVKSLQRARQARAAKNSKDSEGSAEE